MINIGIMLSLMMVMIGILYFIFYCGLRPCYNSKGKVNEESVDDCDDVDASDQEELINLEVE